MRVKNITVTVSVRVSVTVRVSLVFALAKEPSRRFFSRRIKEPSSLLFELKFKYGGCSACYFCLLFLANVVLSVRNLLCESSDDVNMELLVTALGLDLFGPCCPNALPLYVYLRTVWKFSFYKSIFGGKVRLI